MSDLFGHIEPSAPFKDIGNQRPSVAEEKAQLCLTLNRLLQTPPRALGAASIQRVREWRYSHKQALRVLQNKASSRQELLTAINTMQGFEA
jgi:hypothetical protein